MAFFDQGDAMKTLSGRRTPRCNKHQFRAKMMVSTYINHLRDIVVEQSGLNKKERKKNAKNCTHPLTRNSW